MAIRIALLYMLYAVMLCFTGCKKADDGNIDDEYLWTYLGLKGNKVNTVVDTPWGLFAGTQNNGVYIYKEDIKKWVSVGLNHAPISEMVFLDLDEPKVLAGISGTRGGADTLMVQGPAIFASMDGGDTWLEWDGELAQHNDGYFFVNTFSVDCKNPYKVYSGSSWGQVLYSDNGGHTWEFAWGDKDTWGGMVLSIAISSNTTGYIWASGITASYYGAFARKSHPNSQFEVLNMNVGFINKLLVDQEDGDRLWMIDNDIYQFINSKISRELIFKAEKGGFRDIQYKGSEIYAVGYYNAEQGSSGTSQMILYKSGDHGKSWASINTPVNTGIPLAIEIDRNERLIINTTDGIWRVQLIN
jgi:hypothetical protein